MLHPEKLNFKNDISQVVYANVKKCPFQNNNKIKIYTYQNFYYISVKIVLC